MDHQSQANELDPTQPQNCHGHCWQERGVPCPQFFSSKGEPGGRRRSVDKEKQGRVQGREHGRVQGGEIGARTRVQGEIGVKTRKVGGGRQLRDVARRLDLEVEQKQKVNKVFL